MPHPEIAAEVTLQPLRRFPLDAAILFNDIMTPLPPMGVDIDFDPGPVIREQVRTPEGEAERHHPVRPVVGVPGNRPAWPRPARDVAAEAEACSSS